MPTDGGTSAEAMQVPLEEDDELEEEEIINDENFLGKRPLDSPEAEEMPAMKRPRLLSTKGDALDVVLLEAREPLSSLNPQKIPPMLSPPSPTSQGKVGVCPVFLRSEQHTSHPCVVTTCLSDQLLHWIEWQDLQSYRLAAYPRASPAPST